MTHRSPAIPASASPQPDPHQAQMLLLSRLWSEAQPVVAAMIAGAVVDFQHSEDLVSQVAETVVMKFDDYDRDRPFTPWALGIARNIILRHYERRAGERLVFFDDRILSVMAVAHEQVAGESAERLAVMKKCLAEIRGKTRRVMEMRYLHGLKPAAIGHSLDMTTNAVWVMLHRGRDAVAKCIGRKLKTAEGEGAA
jgi:RNA polymerase sigma-70 factor (ECF subfamily)